MLDLENDDGLHQFPAMDPLKEPYLLKGITTYKEFAKCPVPHKFNEEVSMRAMEAVRALSALNTYWFNALASVPSKKLLHPDQTGLNPYSFILSYSPHSLRNKWTTGLCRNQRMQSRPGMVNLPLSAVGLLRWRVLLQTLTPSGSCGLKMRHLHWVIDKVWKT